MNYLKVKERKNSAVPLGKRWLIGVVGGVLLQCLFSFPVYGDEGVEVRISSEPAMPQVVERVLEETFAETIGEVLDKSGVEEIGEGRAEIEEAIRAGINIVIEPKGYSVWRLELTVEEEKVRADVLVHPKNWSPEDPRAVREVDVRLSGEGLSEFWAEKLGWRLDEAKKGLLEIYARSLVGLPVDAADKSWALNLALKEIEEEDPESGLFSSFEVERRVSVGERAEVELKLKPRGDLVELLRPRMYSRTLPNFVLDRLRERLLSKASFIENMPKAEVERYRDEIGEALEKGMREDELMRRLRAEAEVEVEVLPKEPVGVLTTSIESHAYHMGVETFIDFGNENKDSAEIEIRCGVLLGRSVEIFANLNYFTNDSTLQPDIGLGVIAGKNGFLGVGYDIEREDPKYFFEYGFSPAVRARGEIFEDDRLNELGITYQFQQYILGGFFTNGDNEYWVRAILKL